MENILRHIIPRTSRAIEGDGGVLVEHRTPNREVLGSSPTCNTVLCLRAGYIKSTANTKKEVAPSPHD